MAFNSSKKEKQPVEEVNDFDDDEVEIEEDEDYDMEEAFDGPQPKKVQPQPQQQQRGRPPIQQPVRQPTPQQVKHQPEYVIVPRVVATEEMLNLIYDSLQRIEAKLNNG